jgi:uncharacterized membrane protein HdeD (DUF308 family)
MGFGVGVLFIVLGLVALLDVVALPTSITDVVETHVLGWILLLGGILSITLGMIATRRNRGA